MFSVLRSERIDSAAFLNELVGFAGAYSLAGDTSHRIRANMFGCIRELLTRDVTDEQS